MKRVLVPILAVAVALVLIGAYGRDPLDEAVAEVRAEVGPGAHVAAVEGALAVASDAPADERARAVATLERTYRSLRRDFAMSAPRRPIRVYLWRDTASYSRYVHRTFGVEPSTRFGIFRRPQRKMVVNLQSGLGTISHELVHAVMADDYPTAPAWLSEGLASLFDRPEFTADGSIRGRVSWRLPELQATIRGRRSVPLAELVAMDDAEFYGARSSRNYAAATHMCFYLQERGLLREFYVACRDGAERDPTGREALESVVGMDLERFDREWARWVAGLVFPVAEVPWPVF